MPHSPRYGEPHSIYIYMEYIYTCNNPLDSVSLQIWRLKERTTKLVYKYYTLSNKDSKIFRNSSEESKVPLKRSSREKNKAQSNFKLLLLKHQTCQVSQDLHNSIVLHAHTHLCVIYKKISVPVL